MLKIRFLNRKNRTNGTSARLRVNPQLVFTPAFQNVFAESTSPRREEAPRVERMTEQEEAALVYFQGVFKA
jgi:hypothetical protein